MVVHGLSLGFEIFLKYRYAFYKDNYERNQFDIREAHVFDLCKVFYV